MGRSGNAVGFAIYLNLLEQIRERKDFDVDAVLLYPEKTDTAELMSVAAKLRQQTDVLTVTGLPQNLRWRKLYELRNGEAVLIENNG